MFDFGERKHIVQGKASNEVEGDVMNKVAWFKYSKSFEQKNGSFKRVRYFM